IHSLCLLNDLYPNVYLAEIMQILPRTLSVSFSVLCLLSILYSTYDFEFRSFSSIESITNGSFLRNARRIDIICISLILLPLFIFIPLAYFTGHYADISQMRVANILFTIHYVVWLIFGIFYLAVWILFWNRFVAVEDMNRTNRKQIPYNLDLWHKYCLPHILELLRAFSHPYKPMGDDL
ncbi:630_t:CDS:2, partial [Acaulospora morrowiae]